MLQLRLLGTFDFRRDDGTCVPVPGRQSTALLACLALADRFTVARQPLAELIWAGRGAEQANASLRQELVRLRHALGEAAFPGGGTAAQPVRFDATGIDIDVVRFRATAAALGGTAEAISLYRGPLLQDFGVRPRDPFGDWLTARRQELQETARGVMLRMLRGGEGSPALAARLLEIDPLCEDAYRFLIRYHAGSGDLPRARDWFDLCETRLRAGGLPVSLETRALIEDAKAEIGSSAVTAFQILRPETAAEATGWLRASLEPQGVVRRPPGGLFPEIADRPSIVVLPFSDLTETAERRSHLLGDIVTEQITAALCRVPGLFVCARHSAMAYRDAAIDVRLVAAELGVRYLIEGSLLCSRRAMRCNVRLIDGHTGLHIWADQIESDADDELVLRDRVLHETVGRIMPRIVLAEMVRAGARREPPRDAWTGLMGAWSELGREQPFAVALRRARVSVREVLAAEPDNPEALAMAAYLLAHLTWARFSNQPLRDRWHARRLLHQALRQGAESPTALAMCAETALLCGNDIDLALALSEEAVRRGPADAQALAMLGHLRRMNGEDPAAALSLIEHAQRLSPRDPRTFLWLLYATWCHWKLADYGAMEATARRSIGLYPNIPWNWLGLAGALALKERNGEAAEALAAVRAMMPSFTPSRFYWGARLVYGRRRFQGRVKADYHRLCDALNVSVACHRHMETSVSLERAQ